MSLKRIQTPSEDILQTKIEGAVNEITKPILDRLHHLEMKVAFYENNFNEIVVDSTSTIEEIKNKDEDNEEYIRKLCLQALGFPIFSRQEIYDKYTKKAMNIVKRDIGLITADDKALERFHHAGISEEGKQQMIIRISSWRYRTDFYKKDDESNGFDCVTYLTKRNIELLVEANDSTHKTDKMYEANVSTIKTGKKYEANDSTIKTNKKIMKKQIADINRSQTSRGTAIIVYERRQ